MTELQKEEIAYEVIKTLAKQFKKFPEDASGNRNAPFHEAFLNAFSDQFEGFENDMPFFISLSSWLHGLNTSIGQSFFENVSHILSGGSKKSFTEKNGNQIPISLEQQNNITRIIEDLKNGRKNPSLEEENKLIFIDSNDETTNIDFTIDVFIENNESIIAIELKSVKPNSGEVKGEKQKILEAKASLHNLYIKKEVNFYIGFPFDPTGEEDFDYDKIRFCDNLINGNRYLAKNEILLGPELWDFLSDEENTMEGIIEIINSIATTDFMKKFHYLNDHDNYLNNDDSVYSDLLKSWYLFRESEIQQSDIQNKVLKRGDGRLINKFKRPLFNESDSKFGEYDLDRLYQLRELG